MRLKSTLLSNLKADLFDSPDLPLEILIRAFDIDCKLLLHCGAGFVEEASLYRKLGFERVIWIEALPQIAQESKMLLSDFPEQSIIQAALWDSNQMMKINVASNFGSSSLLRSKQHSEVFPDISFNDTVTVQTQTLDSMQLSVASNFFMVLDLQGAELRALRGASRTLENCSFLYVEVSQIELYEHCPSAKEIVTFLSQKFDLVDWRFSRKYRYGNLLFARKDLIKRKRITRLHRLCLTFTTSLRRGLD